MEEVALYYPYVSPPTAWLKQSLLLFEKLSSIVAPTTRAPDGDLGWLESKGVWTPTYVRLDYTADYRDEIETSLLEFADNDNYRVGSFGSTERYDLTPIYAEKLADQLEWSMETLELARRRRNGDLLVHRNVAAIVLAITAKYVAAAYRRQDSRMICSTDLPIFEKIAYDPLRGSRSRSRCLELLLDGLVPVPGNEVPYPDIIDFREHHPDELRRLRLKVAEMLRVIQDSADPFDEIHDMRDEIRQSVNDIKRAARSRRIRLVAGSCSVLALGAITRAVLHGETLHWVFDGFGVAAVATLMDRLVRGRGPDDAFAYLLSAQSAFGDTTTQR
jgi:Family of unknown function (DUF6236)